MSLLDKICVFPRRTMVLFFIIETSGGMAGHKIAMVNQAIGDVLLKIKDLDENADAQIKIAVLEFSSGARWLTPDGPVDVNDYNWNNLDAAGVVDFGAACRALNEKLSTKAFMTAGSYPPVLFLISCRGPTDDWQKELDKLKKNNWYKAAAKAAIAIREDVEDITADFTGSKDLVILIKSDESLRESIKFLALKTLQVSLDNQNSLCSTDHA